MHYDVTEKTKTSEDWPTAQEEEVLKEEGNRVFFKVPYTKIQTTGKKNWFSSFGARWKTALEKVLGRADIRGRKTGKGPVYVFYDPLG